MSDRISEPVASPTGPTSDEQARVERAATETGSSGTAHSARGHEVLSGLTRNVGLVIVLLLLGVIGQVTSDNFLTSDNIRNILVSSSVIGVVTVGHDVRDHRRRHRPVGRRAGRAGVASGRPRSRPRSYGTGRHGALRAGRRRRRRAGQRRAHRLRAAWCRSSRRWPCWSAARGLAAKIADNRTQIVEAQTINDIARTDLVGIPLLVIIFAVVVAAGWVVLNRTTFGRRTFAVGGNPEAARLAGIDVKRHTLFLYVLVRPVLRHRRGHADGPDHDRGRARTATSTSSTPSPRSSSAAPCSPAAAAPSSAPSSAS